MVLELLADAPRMAGGRVQRLPTEDTILALDIPRSPIVFDLYQVAEMAIPFDRSATCPVDPCCVAARTAAGV